MKKVFEKIIEKLKELKMREYNDSDEEPEIFDPEEIFDEGRRQGRYEGFHEAIKIVQEESENSGWILCSEKLPEEYVPVNVTWINRKPESYYAKIKDIPFSATAVYYNGKWYWYSSTCVDYLNEYGKNDFDLIDKNIDVIAWQPLPEPYQPKGE